MDRGKFNSDKKEKEKLKIVWQMKCTCKSVGKVLKIKNFHRFNAVREKA